MDIHKPKPVRNLRELASEIGVIVIGILIALGLEQVIETLHTRHQTEIAQQAVDREVRFNLAKANRELDMRDCMERQMVALSAAIGRGDQAQVRRLMGSAGFVGPFPWTHAAWQAAVDSGAADHFDPVRRRNYWLIYGTVNASDRAQDQYWDAYAQLRSLALSGLSGSPEAARVELTQMARLTAAEEQMLSATLILRNNGKKLFGFVSTKAEMAAIPGGAGELEQCQAGAASMVGPAGGEHR
jgi:hypothetical protein